MHSRFVISHCIVIFYDNESNLHFQRSLIKPNLLSKFAIASQVYSYVVNAKFTATISSAPLLTLEKA